VEAVTAMTHEQAALELVHQGWSHLQHQRPQAAWAAWHRALRRIPGFPAAQQALATLESALELPAAARAAYAFQSSTDAVARARWREHFPAIGLEDLDSAATAFAALAAADPTDGAAAYNEGLCLAWQGRNSDAIAALDRAVRLLAPAAARFERAVEAWTLAEVLRQGGDAEALADDLSYAWIVAIPGPEALEHLAGIAAVVPVAAPRDPVSGEQIHAGTAVFEWLDRPMPAAAGQAVMAGPLPRVLATVMGTPHALRLSSPDPRSLEALDEPLRRALGDAALSIRREAAPLPLPLLDAAVWTLRLPPELERTARDELIRGAVEAFYEDRWIHGSRKGLEGLSPMAAARRASDEGDAVLRARLTAVVRLREQLGARPRTAELYQGYPFDRLRRRLGLERIDPAAVDPHDLSCADAVELDQLDPAALDDVRLADAFESAAGLEDDTRTVRFAAALARRPSPRLTRLDLPALFAPLVRQAMASGRPEQALEWLDRAGALATDHDRRTFDVWRAEVQARSGDPDAALETYQALLERAPADTALARDAALFLLDNGYEAHARILLPPDDEALL
jgi:tetratricopeptide (TPR) repeat protein